MTDKHKLLSQSSPGALLLDEKNLKAKPSRKLRPPVEVLAYRLKDAAIASGISRSKLYEMMPAGSLRTIKVGGSRLVPREALFALLLLEGEQ